MIIWKSQRLLEQILPVGLVDDDKDVPIIDEEGKDNNDGGVIYEDDDHNVGFGSADLYYVEELIELLNKNLKETNKKESDYCESTDDIIKDLRVGCVSDNSKNCTSLQTLCFCFIFISIMNI